MNSRPLVAFIAFAMLGGLINGIGAQQLSARPCQSNKIQALLKLAHLQIAPGSHYSASSITVMPPTVQLSTTILRFIAPLPHPLLPPKCINTSPNPQTVTLTNTGPGVLHISSITIAGPFAQTNNCGGSLGVGQSCSIVVTWRKATSLNTYSLSIYDDGAGSPQLVHLNGILGCPFQ